MQCLANLSDSRINALFGVQEDVLTPQAIDDRLPAD
jgi:hypothetical protein